MYILPNIRTKIGQVFRQFKSSIHILWFLSLIFVVHYIICMYRYNKWGIMSKKVKTRNIAYVS